MSKIPAIHSKVFVSHQEKKEKKEGKKVEEKKDIHLLANTSGLLCLAQVI